MNNKELYQAIFKRKSFHLFGEVKEKISNQELDEIKSFFASTTQLCKDLNVEMKIRKESEPTSKRGGEYCLLFYSDRTKDNYLMNVGYIVEQMDLFLVCKNIGTLWFGIGHSAVKEDYSKNYVIMLVIAKKDPSEFRKDMYKSKRKELNEIFEGNDEFNIMNVLRFAPSACNSQPWFVEEKGNELFVYRIYDVKRRGIMPLNKITFYNRIDMGIFILFLDVILENNSIKYDQELFVDDGDASRNKTLVTHLTFKK